MEQADQILALRRVDAGLAADRAIHLRQQGRRRLHEIDAAQQNAGGETNEVADDAAAQRDQQGAALDAEREDAFAQVAQMSEVLRLFARRQNDGVVSNAGSAERGGKGAEVQARDALIADHDHPLLREKRQDQRAGPG